MQFARSGDVKPIMEYWHRGRQRAREQAFNSDLDFFGDVERVKLDLNTAQIDGSDNVFTWTWDRPLDLFGVNGVDVRTLRDR